MQLLNEVNNIFIQFPFLVTLTNLINDFTLNVIPLISVILFPFYVIVNRKNKKRDEKTPIFFITNYFFKVTCFTESLTIVLFIIILVLYAVAMITQLPVIFLQIVTLATGGLFLVKGVITLVINILITLLAIHRFLLYFFSKLGNFITPPKTIAKIFIILLHILMMLVVFNAEATSNLPKEEQEILAEQFQIYQLATNFIMLLCSLPYLFMIMSIRKLTNLSSNIQSRPEQYIKYQIVIIFISKITILPFWIAAQNTVALNKTDIPAPAFTYLLICEALVSPLMIQLAYLLSNKTNSESLKMAICCCKKNKNMLDSKVEPTETAADSMPTVPLQQNTTMAATAS